MSTNTPYGRLVGVLTLYTAAALTSEPVIDVATPSGWTELGPTDGDQQINHIGALTYFTDNDGIGRVKAVRPEDNVEIVLNLVNLTLENLARILHSTSNVATGTSGSADTKTIPLRRSFEPTEYAFLLKGLVDSPYGAFPAHYYIPRAVIDGEPSLVRSKSGSPMVEMRIAALDDTAQSAGNEQGWLRAQIS